MLKTVFTNRLVILSFLCVLLVCAPLCLGGEYWLFLYLMLSFSFLISLFNLKKLYKTFNYICFSERFALKGLLLLLLISLCFTVSPYLSLNFFFSALAFICLLAMSKLVISSKYKWFVVSIIIFSACLQLPVLILQKINLLPSDFWIPDNFVAGSFLNHNHLAALLEVSLPISFISIYCLKDKKNHKSLMFFMILALMIQILMFLWVQSRGAWIAFTVSFLFFLFKFVSLKRYVIFLLLLCFAGFIIIKTDSSMLIIKNMRFNESAEKDHSSEGRIKIWKSTISMIQDNPLLGTGPGTFSQVFPNFRPFGLLNFFVNQPHNDYLGWIVENGILSIPLIMMLLISIIMRGFKRSVCSFPITVAVAISTLSLALHSFVDYPFRIPAVVLFFAVLTGLSYNEKQKNIIKK